MLGEYVSKFYVPAAERGRVYQAAECAGAREVARWKERVRAAWPGVNIRRLGAPSRRIAFGERVMLEASVGLNGLSAQDVVVELVMEDFRDPGKPDIRRIAFAPDAAPQPDGTLRYALDLEPEICGKLDYRIRAYPTHPLLMHPFELGLMIWA
jgi:starch phosphorylase